MKRWNHTKLQRHKKSWTTSLLGDLSPQQIILKPLITEKSLSLIDDNNTYVFHVHSRATKIDVKKSIESIFGVSPSGVRTVVVPFKWRMQRKLVRKSYKKAYVSLSVWDSIEFVS